MLSLFSTGLLQSLWICSLHPQPHGRHWSESAPVCGKSNKTKTTNPCFFFLGSKVREISNDHRLIESKGGAWSLWRALSRGDDFPQVFKFFCVSVSSLLWLSTGREGEVSLGPSAQASGSRPQNFIVQMPSWSMEDTSRWWYKHFSQRNGCVGNGSVYL